MQETLYNILILWAFISCFSSVGAFTVFYWNGERYDIDEIREYKQWAKKHFVRRDGIVLLLIYFLFLPLVPIYVLGYFLVETLRLLYNETKPQDKR
jgi:hypothetical protein